MATSYTPRLRRLTDHWQTGLPPPCLVWIHCLLVPIPPLPAVEMQLDVRIHFLLRLLNHTRLDTPRPLVRLITIITRISIISARRRNNPSPRVSRRSTSPTFQPGRRLGTIANPRPQRRHHPTFTLRSPHRLGIPGACHLIPTACFGQIHFLNHHPTPTIPTATIHPRWDTIRLGTCSLGAVNHLIMVRRLTRR